MLHTLFKFGDIKFEINYLRHDFRFHLNILPELESKVAPTSLRSFVQNESASLTVPPLLSETSNYLCCVGVFEKGLTHKCLVGICYTCSSLLVRAVLTHLHINGGRTDSISDCSRARQSRDR